jgi:hypothetical protein
MRHPLRLAVLLLIAAAAGGCPSGKSANDTPPPPAFITTSPLPAGTVGRAYSTTMQFSGGTPPYTYVLTAGALPAGLSLAANGTISGTPTTFVSSTTPPQFTIRVTDANGSQFSGAFSMSVAMGSPQALDTTPIVVANSAAGVVAHLGGAVFNPGAAPAQYVVVWDDTSNGNRDVFRRAFGTDGTALAAGAPVIGGGEANGQVLPGLAFDSANSRYLVPWATDNAAGARGALLAQDFTVLAGGTSFAISAALNIVPTEQVAAVFSAPTQRHLVAWQDNQANDPVLARLVDSAGVVQGAADIAVSDAAAVDNRHPAAAWDPGSDQFLVVWSQFNAGATESTIRGRFVTTGGVALGASFGVSAATAAVRVNPSVTFHPVLQQYVVVWSERATAAATRADITGRLVQTNGAPGTGFAIANPSVSLETTPAVSVGTNGIGLLVWVSNRTAANGLDLYMAKMDAAGNAGQEAALVTGVEEGTLNDQAEPRLAFDSANARWLCAYGSFNAFAAPTNSKIKAIRVTP